MKHGGPMETSDTPGRSSLRRGAWIETVARLNVPTPAICRSSLRRGAWIETSFLSKENLEALGRSSLRRGAWIETCRLYPGLRRARVAPLFGGERGLKQDRPRAQPGEAQVAPLFGGERGLKPMPEGVATKAIEGRSSLRRGAWIETPVGASVPIGWASLLSSEGSVD